MHVVGEKIPYSVGLTNINYFITSVPIQLPKLFWPFLFAALYRKRILITISSTTIRSLNKASHEDIILPPSSAQVYYRIKKATQ